MKESLTNTEKSPEISVSRARMYISEQFPNIEIQELVPYGSGEQNMAFLLNGNYIFRFAADRSSDKFDSEVYLLPELEKHLSIPVPHIEYFGLQDNGLPFIGYERLEGEPMSNEKFEKMSDDQKKEFFRQLGTFAKELREFPISPELMAHIPVMDYAKRLSSLWDACEEKLGLYFSTQEISALKDIFSSYDKFDTSSYKESLIHRDLSPANILFDPKSGGITGIIDWSNVAIGDPAFEFRRIYMIFGEEWTREMLRHSDLSEENISKMKVYSIPLCIRSLFQTNSSDKRERLLRFIKAELKK